MLIEIKKLVKLCEEATDSKIDYIYKEGILIFSGTNNWGDWLYNLDNRSHLGYHKGFYRMTRKLTFANGIPHSEVKLVIGYSLGGAIASIYAIQNDKPCITFSAPKCVTPNLKYKKIINIKRYITLFDPVPLISLGFKHPLGEEKIVIPNNINPHSLDNFNSIKD